MAEEQKRQTFAVNEYLLKEGAQGSVAYLIMGGKVEIRLGALGDHPRTLAVLGKGDLVGEMSLFDDKPHMASAVAVEETVVGTISVVEFNQRVEKMDPLMRGILNIMVKRLRKIGESMAIEGTDADWSNWNK